MSHIKLTLLALSLAVITVSGCGGNNQAKLKNDLKTLGLAYISFFDDNKKSPANWDELIAYAEKAKLSPDAIKRVRDAGYTVTWNANLNDAKAPKATTPLAKPAGAGLTLMMDGGVN